MIKLSSTSSLWNRGGKQVPETYQKMINFDVITGENNPQEPKIL